MKLVNTQLVSCFGKTLILIITLLASIKTQKFWNETSTFFGQNGTHYRNHLPSVTSDKRVTSDKKKKEMLAMRQLMLFTGQPLERHQFAARDFQEVFTTPCSLGQQYHYHSHQHYHPHKIIIISTIHCC